MTVNAAAHHVHLHITLGTEILVEISDLNLRTKGTLIGMENSSYLIIKLSNHDLIGNFRSDAVKESPVIIRYLYKGSVYGFKSSILNIISVPSKLFFITYPTKIEGVNVRTSPRYECILPAHAKLNENLVETVIVDISRQGCRCVIKTTAVDNVAALYESIDINKQIEVKIQLPSIEDKIIVKGAVRNINKDEDRVVFGILFDEIKAEAQKRLDSFIALIADIGH